MTTDIHDWLANYAKRFDQQLQAKLESDLPDASRLHQAMSYALLGGGKRIRPALCTLVANLDIDDENGFLAGAALEAIHSYSLVHDDLPAMDDDDLRRGRATTHVKFDEATAILCGDALQAYAFELLTAMSISADQKVAAIAALATAVGQQGMVYGQQLDIDGSSVSADWQQVSKIHQLKTAALVRAAFELGAIISQQDPRPWSEIGDNFGMLFQIVDDILDATANSEQLGKTAGKDLAAAKQTAVSSLGLDGAQKMAVSVCEQLQQQLTEQGVAPQSRMGQLPAFLLERRF